MQSVLAPGGVPRWRPVLEFVNDAVPDDEAGARVKVRRMMLGALFFEHEVCSDADIAARVVRERAAEPDVALEELGPGLWFLNTPPSLVASGEGVPMTPLSAELGLKWAGAGAGFADMHALNALGWTTQKPARCFIAVLDGTPDPLRRSIRHVARANPERRRLGWAEVTLLEALRYLHMAELSIREIHESLDTGRAYRRMGPFAEFRRDVIADVMRSEPEVAADRSAAAETVLTMLPEHVDAWCWRSAGVANRPAWQPSDS